MSPVTKYGLAGAGLGILALIFLPTWVALLIIGGLIAAPVIGYLALDPHQRRRVRRVTRKRIES